MDIVDLHLEEEVLEHYLKNLYLDARQRVLIEMYELGCGCMNCKRQAAYNLTQIELYILQLPEGSRYWYVDEYGDFQFFKNNNRRIILSDNPPEFSDDWDDSEHS